MGCSAIRTRENEQDFDNKSQGHAGGEIQWEKITGGRGASNEIRGLSTSEVGTGEKSWNWMGQG